MSTFKEGEWEYEFPFDLNFQDVSGQTVLYLACFLGHAKLVDMLLKFKVKASRKPPPPSSGDKSQSGDAEGANPDNPDILSPTRRRISDGIQSIMSRLSLGSRANVQESNEKLLSPWLVDMYCNNGMETALHAAVGAKQHEIAAGLVNIARANVNLSTRPNTGDQSISPRSGNEESVTPLVLACSNRDLSTVDLLLKAGARDDDCKALAVVVAARYDNPMTFLIPEENSLRSMSHITSYPNSLKQLDLSHNKISCWPSLPQIDSTDPMELAAVTCYCPDNATAKSHLGPLLRGRQSLRTSVLSSVCIHRRHLRLDSLRTLILADNNITRIQLSTDDDGEGPSAAGSFDELEGDVCLMRTRLMFPNLSMLDLSNNQLKDIPVSIHELSNLSVLNVSNNRDITELPYQMGLLSRLWNLNTKGCCLQEPLRSMIESNKYKTMDILGYLKSVLEDAKPYARMKLMIVGIQAITRLDLSHNCLPWAPPALFQLPSLRVLNLAQNKIERLPSPQGGDFEQASPLHSVAGKRGRSEAKGYWLPVLEELYLQFNRLETIPEDIFHLPCLITLDLSNNKLQALSSQMWRSPKLKELNVAFNLLKELPTIHNAE
ncbi:leucine-rich repeat serine/threonine-protein kinase 1-like, partial [Diaphorina citri]|uniref:Leucine-rich repeat serine/threonine-protein kinase 1-like n=1 Tax=Diaphorina citri TaxID=121845 RepID=A0A3Q0JM36_DIACI